MQLIDDIQRLLLNGDIEGVIDKTTQILNKPCSNNDKAELYFIRGKAYWRLGNRQCAMNDYAEAVALNPDSPAAFALEHAGDIEQFFNPDLLNP